MIEDIKEIYPILADLEGLAASMATDHISIPMAHSYSMTIHEKILQLLRGKNMKISENGFV